MQDKIEYENFIVNAGVRLDYFDARAQVPADPEDPNIFNPFKKINRFHLELSVGWLLVHDAMVAATWALVAVHLLAVAYY